MSSRRTLLWRVSCALFLLLFYTSAHPATQLTIDHPSDTAFLPYRLEITRSVENGTSCKPVSDMLRVLEPRRAPSDSIKAIVVQNSPLNQDEAASAYIEYLPSGTVITQDPVYLTITDYAVFRDRTTGRYGEVCGGYRGDSAFIVRNFPGDNTFDFLYIASGVDHTGNGHWEPSLQYALTDDYDYDGTPEMFFYMACGRDKRPRALVCVDIEKLAIEWYLPMASSPGRNDVVSCRDSLHPGVLVCNYGSENGESDPNFDDRSGYFCRVDSRGQVVYNYQAAPKFRAPALLTRPFDSLYVLFHPWPLPNQKEQDTTYSWLSLVTASGTLLRSVPLTADVRSMSYHQCDADSSLELVVVDANGRVQLFAPDLTLKAASGPSELSSLIGEVTLAGRTEPAFVFSTRSGTAIYSKQFECLAVLPHSAGDFLPTSFGSAGQLTSFAINGGNSYYLVDITPRSTAQVITTILWRYHTWFVVALVMVSLLLILMTYRRRSALRALERLEQRNRAILNASPDLMFRISRDGVILDYRSGTKEDQLYAPFPEFLNKNMAEVMPQWFADQALSLIRRALDTGQMQIFEYQLPINGTPQDYEARMVTSGKDEVLAVIRNITERKASQAVVERQAQILQQVQDAIILTDTNGIVIDWNKGAERVSGFSAEEIIGKHISLAVSAEGWPAVDQTVIAALKNDKSFQGEIKARTKWGTDLYLQWSASVMHDSSGRPVSWVGYGADITARHQMERALRESEERYRDLFENTSLGIYRTTPDGRILMANPALIKMLGYTSFDELKSRNLQQEGFEPSYPREKFIQHIDREGEVRGLEAAWFTATGSTIFVRENAHAVKDEHGHTVFYEGMIEDITDHIRTIEALMESEEKYRSLAEHSNLAILIYDDQHIYFANERLAQVLETSIATMLALRTPEFIAILSGSEQVDCFMKQIRTRLAGQPISPHFEANITTFKGNRKRLEALSTPVSLGNKTVVQATWLDITARHEAEQALRESEEKYRTLAEYSNLGILLFDDERVYFANQQLANLLEIPVDRLSDLPTADLVSSLVGPELADRWIARIRGHLTGQLTSHRFETDITTFQGNRKRLEALATPITLFNKTVVQATWLDITARYKAELALRESEEKYRTLAEFSSQGILLLDSSRIIFVNKRFAEILETTAEALSPLTAYDLLSATAVPAEIDKWMERLRTRLDGKELQGKEEIDVRTFRGKKRRVEAAITRIELSGKPVVQITWIDITARYEAEQALRISESKFRAVTESMSAAITIFGTGHLLYCNPASERITGFTLEELLQKNFWEMIHPDYRDLVQQRGRERMAGGEVPSRYEVKIVTKTGEEKWVDYAAQVVEFGGGPAVLGTAIDITERKTAEEALQRLYQERYEQVKEIAGGVSHEIYNALFPAVTTLFTLRNRLQKGASTPDDLPRNLKLIDLADQSVARAIHMTETVTRFSRLESDRQLDHVRIDEVIGDILQQLRMRIDAEEVKVAVSIPPDLAVVCNRGHLYSLFTNLIMNALDALTEMTVRQLTITARSQNTQAIIKVCDSGPGIPAENLPKIFNAFFSTKPRSGTGLGLAVVQKIVDLYGGHITVDSCLDRGTAFTILLPLTTQQWGETSTGTHEGKDPDR